MNKAMGYHVAFRDKKKQREVEAIKVFCPHCGAQAKLIWSVANDGLWPSWSCCNPECPKCQTDSVWSTWFTVDPEPYREKPQRFKNLFDF